MASKIMNKVNSRTRYLARKAPFLDAVSLRLLANSLVLYSFFYTFSSMALAYGTVVLLHVGKHQFQELGWLPLEARSVPLQLQGAP